MSDKKIEVSYNGIGFFGLLTIVLIVMNLMGYINISWWLIAGIFFAPLIIMLAFVSIALFFATIIAIWGK